MKYSSSFNQLPKQTPGWFFFFLKMAGELEHANEQRDFYAGNSNKSESSQRERWFADAIAEEEEGRWFNRSLRA